MTTKYRVEYALKSHRRDQFIEWIKGLLAVPFVLHSQPTAVFEPRDESVERMASVAHRRYAEIMKDVEELINDHIAHQNAGRAHLSKLKHLVPSVGTFFTPLCLHEAFLYQDQSRLISYRRFVAPSFNDIRLILNTAQIMSLVRQPPPLMSNPSGPNPRDAHPIELITFDGDVTLYDDGGTLEPTNPAVARILALMARGTKIGIVTAAGYTQAARYYERLHGLLDAILHAPEDVLPSHFKQNLVVMGGEANYLFKFSAAAPDLLEWVARPQWQLEAMAAWRDEDITALLDAAQASLAECVRIMRMDATVLRKERGVGIVPASPSIKFPREQLEETVLVTQKMLEMSEVGRRLPFCAFNGGNDIFVDIGDKSWGVLACQRFFGGIGGDRTLHVGDQFLSAGANDFKARLACTTAWIASPAETVALLDEIDEVERVQARKVV